MTETQTTTTTTTYDFLVVGAGLSGATLANKLAAKGHKILIIDKRNHIGGNCYDYIDSETGIRVSEYGPHFFHTNDEEVWNYVNTFGEWIRYDHKSIALIDGIHVPVPVNAETINRLCGQHLKTPEEVATWLKTVQIQPPGGTNPINSEEIGLQRVGNRLYQALFKPYTLKQWAKEPSELDASVLARIPVRDDNDCRYFTDRFQGLPLNGYTEIFKKMLAHPNITVILNMDYESVATFATYDQVIFTGRIDSYFSDAGLPQLEYRSLNFEKRFVPTFGYAQRGPVVNYPSSNIPHTRSVEYKWFPNCPVAGQDASNTIVVYETSCDYNNQKNNEPYYPVPSPINQALYERYKTLASSQKNVHFIGRLASYKYFNMDQAIRAALDYFEEHF